MSTDAKLLFFKLPTCPKCPDMETVTDRVASDLKIGIEIFSADRLPPKLKKNLYRENIVITVTPSIVLWYHNRMYPVVFGKVVPREELRDQVKKILEGTPEVPSALENLAIRLSELLPDVRTSAGDIQQFEQEKIIQSIVKQTGISNELAEKVMIKVTKRLISSNIKWLSGPQIREMCCSVLAEFGLESARKRYTRIGMPIMDYEDLLRTTDHYNPESIHSRIADHIASEYALLRLIGGEEADAHLRGDIHIHMLRYFDIRPYCAEWDLRIILEHGLPPKHGTSNPPNNSLVAATHAAKWLKIIQYEYASEQNYDNFTVFMAPFLDGIPYETQRRNDVSVKDVAQCFVFESQNYGRRDVDVPPTSITCTPTIPKPLRDVPAVSYGGKISGVYGDYEDECEMFFRALSDVYGKGNAEGKPFNSPRQEIKVKKSWLTRYEDLYRDILRDNQSAPHFINTVANWIPYEVHSQCNRIVTTRDALLANGNDPDLFDWGKAYVSVGSLQSASINLPRCAYNAGGDDDRLFECIQDQLNIIGKVLLIKWNLVEKNLKARHLPMSAICLDGIPLLDLRKQTLSISFVGLNECVLYHTGEELHESPKAYDFGKRIIQFLATVCRDFTDASGIHFSLWADSRESNRFAKLDLKHYRDVPVPSHYTNSSRFNYDADIPLLDRIQKQGDYHAIIKGGVITPIQAIEYDSKELWDIVKTTCLNTNNVCFTFVKT